MWPNRRVYEVYTFFYYKKDKIGSEHSANMRLSSSSTVRYLSARELERMTSNECDDERRSRKGSFRLSIEVVTVT